MKNLSSFFLALALALLATGCSTIAPGNDPVVVRTEQATAMAYDTIDAFLLFERANEAALGSAVHAVAERLRAEAPRALLAVRSATKTYKLNRNADNKATLATALAVLEQLANDATDVLANQPRAMVGIPAQAVAGPAILLAVQAVLALVAWLRKEQSRLVQTGELTPAESAALDKEIADGLLQEHWKTDAQRAEPEE